MSELTPTRSAVLELRAERHGMQEGYHFLDEKRLVLAAEMLQELGRYERTRVAFEGAQGEAFRALQEATARHGLEGVQLYPALVADTLRLRAQRRQVLGVLVEDGELEATWSAPPAAHPSPEAEHCRRAFADLLPLAVRLAAIRGNLERLLREYLRTARRARALEDVLLPEIDRSIGEIETALEDMDREEAVRVRSGHTGGTA